MFATPLPRECPEPGKRAVRPGSVVWVDLDEASADGLREVERLRPHLWVASGAGQHLYWRLRDELEPAEVAELNRRLCHRLGGDPACCEYGRIMRHPGTFNQKRGQWCRILRADRSRAPADPEAVRAALPDPDPPRPDSGSDRQGQWTGEPDELAKVAPPAYFLALCGLRVPDAGGAVRCPLPDHDDPYPSCQVYAEAEQGWWCFGCQRGAFRSAREPVAAALG